MANISHIISETSSSNGKGTPWSPYIAPAFLSYVFVCWLLRYNRRDAMHKKFNYPNKASFSAMTNTDAQAIMQYQAELEYPKMYEMSIQFALFKTYGIPTISSLLAATKEFSTPENANKRYTDTAVLIQEFTSHQPRDERVIKAIARMNYIHTRYRKAGKISNEDLLYTLSVFITQPIDWIGKYEWRPMTDMERCAIGTFWKSIGDAMGITYEGFLAHSEWKDGLDFSDDITTWAKSYEDSFMVPAATNKKTADELIPLLLYYVPKSMKPAAANMVGVMMGDRLRKAMMYPNPSKAHFFTVNLLLSTRKFFLRHLSLPRPSFMNVRQLGDPDPKTGRMWLNNYLGLPFYIKPGFLNRWGPDAWLQRIFGGPLPGDDDDRFIPQGYRFEEVGPKSVQNKGLDETTAWEQKLSAERPVGCPFAFAR